MVVPLRDGAARDGDKVRLLRTAERLTITDLPFVAQHAVHPAVREPGADVEDGVAADVEGAAHLSQAPAFPQFEHYLSADAGTGARVSGVDEGLQAGPASVGQPAFRTVSWDL